MGRDTSRYYVNAVRVPSVTEVLELAGVRTMDAVPEDVLEKARRRGVETHHWIDLYEQGGEVAPEDVEVMGRVEAYRRFREATPDLQIKHSEYPMVSSMHRFAGTTDLVGQFENPRADFWSWAVIDLKPPWQPHPWYALQTAGYALLLVATGSTPSFSRVDGPAHEADVRRFALQLGNDGNYKLHRHEDRGDFHDFLACLRVAHYKLRTGSAHLDD